MEPYGHVAWNDEESESSEVYFAAKSYVSGNSGKPNILSRVTTNGCVSEESGMPRAQCLRYELEDLQRNDNPKAKYGWSDQKLFLEFKCECNVSGKYQASFNSKSVNEVMEIYMSFWVNGHYELYERCRVREEMQRTYRHEVEHIENGRYVVNRMAQLNLPIAFNTKRECEDYNENKEKRYLNKKWNEWKLREKQHANLDPASPKEGDDIHAYDCY